MYMYNHYTFFLKFQKFLQNYMRINSTSFYLYIYFTDATFATHARDNPARLIHRHGDLDRWLRWWG